MLTWSCHLCVKAIILCAFGINTYSHIYNIYDCINEYNVWIQINISLPYRINNSAIQGRDLFLQVWSRNYLAIQDLWSKICDLVGIWAWFHLGGHTMRKTMMWNGEQCQYFTDLWVLHLLHLCVNVKVTALKCSCFCVTGAFLRTQHCVHHGLQLQLVSASSHGNMANGRPGAGWDWGSSSTLPPGWCWSLSGSFPAPCHSPLGPTIEA